MMMAVSNQFIPCDMDNHPLLINSVLETLFSFLDMKNLKNCRFVCGMWKTEAFRVIRKRSRVNLDTKERQQSFLKSGIAENFKKFSFSVNKWNDTIAPYLSLKEPNSLETDVDLNLTGDDNGNSLQTFEHLLMSQADSLVKLNVNVDCLRTTKFDIPENLLTIKLPKLEKLRIVYGRTEVSWLQNLWTAIFRNSPALKAVDLRNLAGDEFWNEISDTPNFRNLTELRYVHDRKTAILGMHQQLSQTKLPATSLKRLCIPFQESDSSLISSILAKVAASLEILEFYTLDETALSPIDFPVMQRLTTLDAGSSQLSFPTIVPAQFPKLTELKATYWDWVYTREDLPDVHYYWRTSNPHPGITDIHIRFPNWAAIDFQYRKLENFNDFSEILHSKFPAACNFTFHNVSLCNDVRQGLEKFAEVFEFAYKMFTIGSYSTTEIYDASPFEIVATEDSKRPRELEVLDLCSKGWPEVWSKKPPLLSTIRDEWLPLLLYFDKLRVLNLLWTKNLFSILDLTNTNNLPNLVHLEYVGDICIDRFKRAAVRRSRPQLTIVQHKTCFCDKEDWWYITDADSGKVFKNLFSSQSRSGSVTSFFKKILFDNLL